MDSNKLNDWMQVIGIFAVVVSLIFVGLQVRQDQEIAIVDTYGSVAETHMNLSVLVGDHIVIWKKGLEGEGLTDAEKGQFEGLVAAVSSHYQRNYIRWTRLGPGDPKLVASEFAYALYIFPGLREVFDAKQKFNSSRDAARGFGNELIPWSSSILRYLAAYDERRPPIPDEKEYLFWAT